MGEGPRRRVAPAVTERREATPDEFKAMAHPLRLRILRLCLHEAMTNKQLADRLGADPATTLHHVRMLVSTGFLAEKGVRTGARGALEKPYRATGKSWVLSVSRPEEKATSTLAGLDALRAELADAAPEDVVAGARMGIRLSEGTVDELRNRIEEFVHELAAREDDPDGEPYGFYVILHRQR